MWMIVMMRVVVPGGMVSPAQVFEGNLQIMIGRFDFLDGGLQVLDHVRVVAVAHSFDPGAKFARVLYVVLDPMGQQRAQLLNVGHGSPRGGSLGAADVNRT
jgi:hypothetical protein